MRPAGGESWDQLYRQAWQEGVTRLQALPGVVLGFHSTIDALKQVHDDKLYHWWADDPELARQVASLFQEVDWPAGGGSPAVHGSAPRVSFLGGIATPAELLAALLDCMHRGKARQLMILEESTFRWALEHIGYDRLRMGGTSGNMANALASLPLRNVTVYAHPLSRQLAELFVDQPHLTMIARRSLPESDAGRIEERTGVAADATGYELIPPRQAAHRHPDQGMRALHWVLEFGAGESFHLPAVTEGRSEEGNDTVAVVEAVTPRANRFIAAWNPENNRLRIDPVFESGLLALGDRFSHFIVSGFHLLSERYPDGSSYRDCLRPVARFLRTARQRHPHLRMHYEFASIASPAIRRGVVEEILPLVDSLGLNEVELLALLRDIGAEDLAHDLEASDAQAAKAVVAGQAARIPFELLLAALDRLGRAAGVRRVHLHNLGYYLCLADPQLASAAQTRQGLLFAALLGAVRAEQGERFSLAQLEGGLAIPLATLGWMNDIAGYGHAGDSGDVGRRAAAVSPAAGVEWLGTGLFCYEGWEGAVVPTRVVAQPRFTVGLGDVISASAFLVGT